MDKMRKISTGVVFLLCSFVASSVFASSWQKSVIEKIDLAIKKHGIKKSNLGIHVTYSGEAGQSNLYLLNESKKFVPASLTKIATAGAVLEKLPVGHKFITSLRSIAPVIDGELKGDLFLVGGGDAGFVSETMWYLVNEFIRSGVTKVSGDIVVDDLRFDQVRFDPGREPSRVDRAYDAPIGAMTFNWSAVNVFVRPGEEDGDPVRVFIDPQNNYISLVNEAKTAKAGTGQQLQVTRRLQKKQVGSSAEEIDSIEVTGTLALDQKEAVFYKAISNPAVWAGSNLREFLRQRGIVVSGKVRMGKEAKGAVTLADVESKPVAELVAGMMKFSNNYIAEILTKNLAVEIKSEPGSMDGGMKVIREYLRDLGIKAPNFNITNPSGFSRRNKFRPEDLHKVLVQMKQSFSVFPELAAALPIAGVDGTLKRRFQGTPAAGQVRAKTGHLAGVTGLAGYVGRPDGREFTFVFMFNGKPKDSYSARLLFDDIATVLVRK